MKDRIKRIAVKINWWAVAILAVQGVTLWQVTLAKNEAADASSEAYEAADFARMASQDAEYIKNRVNGF